MSDPPDRVPAEVIAKYTARLQEAYRDLQRRCLRTNAAAEFSCHASDPRWERLAEELAKQQADPCAYVRFVFNIMLPVTHSIQPNMVTSGKLLSQFLEQQPIRREELRLMVCLQTEHVRARLQQGEPLETILLDTSAPLSAVFRYVMARSEKRWDLSKRFEEAAKSMLLFEPYYKELLGAWLPEGLRHG